MKRLLASLVALAFFAAPAFAQVPTTTQVTQNLFTIPATPGDLLVANGGVVADGNVALINVALPPIVSTVAPGTCIGGAGDAATINTLYSTYIGLGIQQNTTCKLSAALELGAFANSLVGGGISTVLQPSATVTSLIDIAPTTNSITAISNLNLSNASSDATDGIHYHGSVGNNHVRLSGLGIIGFTNGILEDATAPGGDGLNVEDNFFQNNSGYAVNFANAGVNGSVHSNYVLGGPGINFGLTASQSEGTRIFDNTVLASIAGASSLNVTAGLELEVFGNIFDQNYAHGVILNASSHPVSAIKLVSNWIGASGSVAASQDGVHMSGGPEYLPMIADTFVGWTGYGVNTGSGGVQHLPIIASKFYNNTLGDLNLNDVAGATLIGNQFSSTASWAEASMASGLVALGNRCANAATGIGTADLILGDGSCAPNQIPNGLTVLSASNTVLAVKGGAGDEGITLYEGNNVAGGNGWQLGANGSNHFFAFDATAGAFVWQMTSGGTFALTPPVAITGVLTLQAQPVFASQTTGGGTQTFTDSPCTGLTTERWIPVSISGQSGTWYIPSCQ